MGIRHSPAHSLNRRLRLAFIAGSEERWLADHGRPMTAEELRRVLRRYPGDLPEPKTEATVR